MNKWEYVETQHMQENYYIYKTGETISGNPFKYDIYRKKKWNGTWKYKKIRRQ